MSEFLIATFEGGGNIAPTIGMIRRLRARGHRVRVLGDAVLREEMEGAGATFRPWTTAPSRADRRPESDEMRDWAATEPGGGLIRLLDHLAIGPAAAHAADTFAELTRAPADALLCCDVMFGPTIGAEAAGVPFVMFGANVSVLPIEGIPPIGPGLMPPATPEDHAVAESVGAWFQAMMNERLPVLNAARATYGLPPLAAAIEQPRGARLTLLATSPAFDFPATALPPDLRYVGPLLDPPDWVGGWQSPWPEDDARPLVLVALSSTFQDQLGTIQRLLDAAASLPLRMVVTLGPALAGAVLRVPDNAAVLDQASHDAVMREAALVVTHCGHGTVMRALANHRPMLCLPMGRDQNDNAARVVARGAGIRLASDAETPALREAIVTLLAEPSYAEAAATLGRAIAEAATPDALVEALEELTGCAQRRDAA